MNIKIIGKDLKATEAITEYIENKISKLEKFFDEELIINCTIKVEKNEQIAEIHINVPGENYRATTSSKDLYSSIDKNIDILERQIKKIKTKKEKTSKEDSVKLAFSEESFDSKAEVQNEIIKTIYYEIRPMAPEDAILKLEEKPKDNFFTFLNIETNKVNVVFKLKDSKNFGLLEPEA